MTKVQYEVDGQLRITIEAAGFTPQELLMAAAVALLENSTTHHWAKHDMDTALAFYDAVLSAVALHLHAVVDDPAVLEGRPAYDILHEMIDTLRAAERLKEQFRLERSDAPDYS